IAFAVARRYHDLSSRGPRMSLTSSEATAAPPAAPIPPPDLEAFAHHWQDEADASYLYHLLSKVERDPRKRDLYQRLSHVEDRHTKIWADLLAASGRPVGPFRPTLRARAMAFLGKTLGPRALLPLLLAEEGREVRAYLEMHRSTPAGAAGQSEALL